MVLSDRGEHPTANQPEVRRVVVDAIRLHGRKRVGRDDMELLRPRALRHGEHLGVEPELQDRPRARLARELRISDLVRPRAERARNVRRVA